ncbi:MAG: helix-turn-helix domain-containing protein [Candidatus Magasanikbacteria bacterium]|nr:helix-turn-helix domain-containing protein [Candidatus Magasanikbacteria bacterium]
MNELENTLIKFGLTDTEAKIYLTGLNFKNIGVSELTKQTGINRTTIYHALDTLTEKGLVAKTGTGARLVFSMADPENIHNLLLGKIKRLEKQKEDLDNLIPLLKKSNLAAGTISVAHYEGIEGIKLAIEDAYYCKSKHWDIIAPIKNFFSDFDKTYSKYFIETRSRRGLTSRSLWEPTEKHKLLTPQQIKERNPKILPPIMHGKFNSVICLYDDKVLIISSLKEKSAILIKSADLHQTMLAIFEGLWSVSKPITTK